MKLLPLRTKGIFAKVDDRDYEPLSKLAWYVEVAHGITYACGRDSRTGARTPPMHQVVMKMHRGATPHKMVVDHIDRDGLNNQLANLRFASYSRNAFNSKTRIDSNTPHKGVCYSSAERKYKAYITVNYQRIHLGTFETIEEAVKARDIEERKIVNEVDFLDEILNRS